MMSRASSSGPVSMMEPQVIFLQWVACCVVDAGPAEGSTGVA